MAKKKGLRRISLSLDATPSHLLVETRFRNTAMRQATGNAAESERHLDTCGNFYDLREWRE